MKRLSIVLVLLLVVAACGFSAWFALREVDLATDRPDRPKQGVVEPTDVDDPEPVVEENGGRKRVRALGADGLPEPAANAVVGRVLYEGDGVAGATVDVYAAPDGDYNVRRGQAREFFGEMFSDDELAQMERRFGGMRPRARVDADSADSSTDEGGAEGGAAIGISVSSTEGVDLEGVDLGSDDVQDAMGAGMEFVGRMMSNPSLLEKALDLGRIEAAGFETDGAWPRVGSAQTEDDGTFAIAGMPSGKVELRVSARGYVRLKKVVTVGEPIELKLSRGTVLEGTVTSAGQPLAGATVRTKTRTLETDGAGRFSVDGAVVPKESVLVSARGFVTTGRSVALTREGPNLPVVIDLEPAAIVRGVVISSEGAPLVGASVRVTSGSASFNPMMFMQLAQQDNVSAPAPSTVTDENGVFELDGIPGGTVKLIAESRGYLPFTTDDIPVTAGESAEGIELKLLRESFVTGKVVGPGGSAVEGATVKVELDAPGGMGAMVAGMFGGSWASARTQADGTFRVGGLTAGERRVRAESTQYLHEEVVLQVPDQDGATQDFALRPGYALEGLVLTPSGDPAAGARIQIQWASESSDNPMAAMTGMARGADATGTADAEGHFRVEGLQEGPYTVTAKAEGFLDGEIDGVAQGATDVMVQLRAAAAIRGVVLDPDGNPIGGAWVHRKGGKRAGGGNPMMAMFAGDPRVLTAADGSFQFPELEAGRYQLYARRKGYAESEKVKLQVAEGESAADIQLLLRAGESLMGRVVEAGSGNAIEGAIVYVVEGSSPMAGMNFREAIDSEPSAPSGANQTRTEADGSFVLEGLTPGRVTVEVRSRDHAPASLARVEVPGAEVTVEVGMGGRVEGYVIDDAGNAVSGTQVILSGGAMGFGRQRLATTDENGFYEMDRVVPGTYQIMKMDSTSAFGVGGMSAAVVKEGETTRHDFKPDATGGGISGIVQRDGEPVAGAMVILSGGTVGMRMTTSDDAGAFTFDALPAGSYAVSVQTGMMSTGRQTQTVRVEERQQVTGVTVQLSSLSLAGRVVDAETGEGIALAQVILFDPGTGTLSSLEDIMRSSSGQAMTDQRGHFKITGIADGTFSVRVSASGYAEETREGVKPGADLTLRLDPGAEFEVTVIGPDGAPVVGATVVARDAQGNETMAFAMGGMQAITTSDGSATLQLAPGRYTIVAESGGLPSGSAEVDAERGSVVIRLEQGGGIEVVVKRGGKPFPGASVALLDEGGLPIIKRVSAGNILGGGGETTDSAGRIVREGLPAGRITVIVTAPGGTPVQKVVTITRGGTEKIDVELP